MPPPLPEEDDEQYASSEDSDFAPEEGIAPEREREDVDSESDADEPTTAGTGKRKRHDDAQEAEDAGFENSGDEAIISKARKRRKKGKDNKDAAGHAAADDDEGGDGGVVKTRSMRAAEKAERKAATVTGTVTVDVDALWAQMTAGSTDEAGQTIDDKAPDQPADGTPKKPSGSEPAPAADADADASDMILIRRTYEFAGKIQHEEKLVARSSAEARVYLASQAASGSDPSSSPQQAKRALKRAFRSAFEPVLDPTLLQRADLNLGVAAARLRADKAVAKKLNTVEKSRMDWAGFVDREGIKDELELAGKSKDSYAARQEFLARSEAVREEESRRARLAGKT